jgi:hypothetical protein
MKNLTKELWQKVLIGIIASVGLSVLGYLGNWAYGILELPKKVESVKTFHVNDSIEIVKLKKEFEEYRNKKARLDSIQNITIQKDSIDLNKVWQAIFPN